MSNAQRSLPSLLREARKCVVLCANCHREVHAGVRTIPDVIVAEILAEFADEPRKPWKNGRPATPIVPR